ncbi:MAG: hypothetical protein LBM97_02175 [Candidatus Nomurabacteria bacterium]|jgi:hypothetical protein|nr:hypothetical protein [Candidatus Nomurabacteria bacterium]
MNNEQQQPATAAAEPTLMSQPPVGATPHPVAAQPVPQATVFQIPKPATATPTPISAPLPAPTPVSASAPVAQPVAQPAPVPQPQPIPAQAVPAQAPTPAPVVMQPVAAKPVAPTSSSGGQASWSPRSIFQQFQAASKTQNTNSQTSNPFYNGQAPVAGANSLNAELDKELEAKNEDAKWEVKKPEPEKVAPQVVVPAPSAQVVSSRQDTGFAPAQIAAPKQAVKRTKVSTTQNSLQIAEIRDNMAIMKDGSFRAVIACKAINFDLMNVEEREAIEYSYQNFLNSLNFDVQILVRSQKIDIAPYLDKLVNLRRNEDNMLLGVLMDDYISFIDALSREANIMSKSFFVCLNYYPIDTNIAIKDQSKNFFKKLLSINNQSVFKIDQRTYNDGVAKISDRCDAVLSGLYQTGIQCARLNTKELAQLYYDFYNPDISVREPLGNFADTTTLYTGKGK